MKRVDGVMSSTVDGCAVLIGPAGDKLVELNVVGSIVWAALEIERDMDELVSIVRAGVAGEVSLDQLRFDVEGFLVELADLGLVSR